MILAENFEENSSILPEIPTVLPLIFEKCNETLTSQDMGKKVVCHGEKLSRVKH